MFESVEDIVLSILSNVIIPLLEFIDIPEPPLN